MGKTNEKAIAAKKAVTAKPVTPKRSTKTSTNAMTTPPTSPDDSAVDDYVAGMLPEPPVVTDTRNCANHVGVEGTSQETKMDIDGKDEDKVTTKAVPIINPYLKSKKVDSDDEDEEEEGVSPPNKSAKGAFATLSAGIISAANVKVNSVANNKPTMVVYSSDKPCKIDRSMVAQNMFANIIAIHEDWKSNGTGMYTYPGWHLCELCRESNKYLMHILGAMSSDTVVTLVDVETGIPDIGEGVATNGQAYTKKAEGVVFFTMNPLGPVEALEICKKVTSVIKDPNVICRNRPLRAPVIMPTNQMLSKLHGPIGKYVGAQGVSQILTLAWGDEFQPYGDFALVKKSRKMCLEAFWPKGEWTLEAAEMIGAPRSFLADETND